MTWETGSRPDITLVYRSNFLHLFPVSEEKPTGRPTRTRDMFWLEDILPTTCLIRSIYPGGQTDIEFDLLKSAWNWVNNKANKELILDLELPPEKMKKMVPPYVLVNWKTVYFFAMKELFKPSNGLPVAYEVNSDDWRSDVRNSVSKFVRKMEGIPKEIGNPQDKLDKISVARLAAILDIDYQLAHYVSGVDFLTWTLLNDYHMNLVRREKKHARV